MKIVPEIVAEKPVRKPKDQRQKATTYSRSPFARKNNRKNTRGRKTQYITCFDMSEFPPVKYTKTIKHFR